MVDRDEFMRLVDGGMSRAAIARELGVTRQRISQLSKQMGLPPTPLPPRVERKLLSREEKKIGAPSPAVSAALISHSMCGKASELFVAADLTARGWNVFLPVYSSRDVDLVARKGDALILVEVRTSKITPKPGRKQVIPRKTNFSGTHYAVVRKGAPVFYEPDLEDD